MAKVRDSDDEGVLLLLLLLLLLLSPLANSGEPSPPTSRLASGVIKLALKQDGGGNCPLCRP